MYIYVYIYIKVGIKGSWSINHESIYTRTKNGKWAVTSGNEQ